VREKKGRKKKRGKGRMREKGWRNKNQALSETNVFAKKKRTRR
jgi:hypothetical protein